MLKPRKSKTGVKKKKNEEAVEFDDQKNLQQEMAGIVYQIADKIIYDIFETETNKMIIELGMKCLVDSICNVIDLYFFPKMSIDEKADEQIWLADDQADPAVKDTLHVDRYG